MVRSQGCRFCTRYASAKPVFAEAWDVHVLSTANFVVVPTKGALVEGWLLVIPRRHTLSLAGNGDATELDDVLARCQELIARIYAPPTFFEHGAAAPESSFGCGIDHAHLHVAPLTFSIEQAVSAVAPEISWRDADAPWRDARQGPYLALREPSQRWRRSEPSAIPRQFFRRAIASRLGASEAYDYDLHPGRTQTERTVWALRARSANVRA